MIFFLPKTKKASPGEIRPRVAFPQWAAGSEGAEEARQPLTDLGPTVHTLCTLCTLHFKLCTHCPHTVYFALCIVQMSTIRYALPNVHTLHTLWCWGQFLSSYVSPLTHHSLFLRIGSDCALSNCLLQNNSKLFCLLQNNFVASISVEKNVQSKQSCSKYLALQQCRVGNAEWHQKTKNKEETGNYN